MPKITNPLNSKQFERLIRSIDWSDRQLEVPKQKRIDNIRQFVGYHHTENAAPRKVIFPFLKMAISIHVRLLAARAPRALITTRKDWLKPTAANLQIAINEIPAEIGLQGTLKRLVLEAMFSGQGVAKIGLYTVGELLGHRVGAPFVDVVTQDDYVLDMSAKHIDQIQYEGNSYWLDYDSVMESDWFPKKSLVGLNSDDYTIIGERGEERAESLGQDDRGDLFKEKINLRDVWIPSEKLMITYGVKTKKLLKVIDWEGPERGPYPKLRFDDVPGNLLGLAPVSIWHDIHDLTNILYRKLSNQADSQKTALGFSGTNDEGVSNFQKAKDGDGIVYTGPKPEKLEAGGVKEPTLAFFMQARDMASWMAGNLDSLGGLSPQSETLGQERLVKEASSAQVRDMAASVIDFSKEIFQTLAYYEWHDPVRRRELERKIPGTDLSIIVPWAKGDRLGKFDMYDLNIDVNSLQENSPSAQLQKLQLIMQQYIQPFMPALQQAGIGIDFQFLLKKVGELTDFPWMEDLIQFVQPLENEPGKMQTPTAPANTTRTNVRVNRPGATESGKSQVLQQTLLGGRPQGAEAASIGRSTG